MISRQLLYFFPGNILPASPRIPPRSDKQRRPLERAVLPGLLQVGQALVRLFRREIDQVQAIERVEARRFVPAVSGELVRLFCEDIVPAGVRHSIVNSFQRYCGSSKLLLRRTPMNWKVSRESSLL